MQKYKILKILGDGSFGIVYKAITQQNEIVAIKKMKLKYKNWQECFTLHEIKSLKKFNHPNIIKLKQIILSSNQLFLIFQYVENNLYQIYQRAKQSLRKLTQQEIRFIFYSITNALSYIHKMGYFHRDMKPENILYYNNIIKLCDFGLARQIRSRPPFTQYVSTRWYRSPELLLHSNAYNSPVDIFALACIIVQLYMMAPLFPGQNQIETMNKIVELLGTPKKNEWPQGYKLASTINYNFPDRKKQSLDDLIPDADPNVIELLQSMLSYNSRKRPSALQILKHSYFNNIKVVEQKCQKYETKLSFYQKNIVEIPNNIEIAIPKQMQMRKSQIKFGETFKSSFHLEKKKKNLIEEKNVNLLQNIKIQEKDKFGGKDKEIQRKFDQMQQLLYELQMKKQKQQQKRNNNNNNNLFELKINKNYHEQNNKIKQQFSTQEKLRMPMFAIGNGTAGLISMASSNKLKSPSIKLGKLF